MAIAQVKVNEKLEVRLFRLEEEMPNSRVCTCKLLKWIKTHTFPCIIFQAVLFERGTKIRVHRIMKTQQLIQLLPVHCG